MKKVIIPSEFFGKKEYTQQRNRKVITKNYTDFLKNYNEKDIIELENSYMKYKEAYETLREATEIVSKCDSYKVCQSCVGVSSEANAKADKILKGIE